MFFIIPPKLGNYGDVLALSDKLPNGSVIDLGDPNRFPDLWRMENSFDFGHLNIRGSNLFTSYLAVELGRRLTD